MMTKSINVMNLNTPCACHCQYCLLSWENKTFGVDRIRAQAFVTKFRNFLIENHPDVNFMYYFGYSMEDEELSESIQFMKSINSIGGTFLQLNGLKMREETQTREFLTNIQKQGIESIDLTFYGTKEYHDRFAGRKGDFEYLERLLRIGLELHLKVLVSIAIYKDNLSQMAAIVDWLETFPLEKIFIRVPSDKGKGVSKKDDRITLDDYNLLPPQVQKYIHREIYQSESEFLQQHETKKDISRTLILSLTNENIGRLEQMDFQAILLELERMDDEYYQVIPPFDVLASQYGNIQGNQLFRLRDLYLMYQQKYISDNHLDLYDVNDESQSCSFRSI